MNTTQLIGNVSQVPHYIGGNDKKKAIAFLTVANNDNPKKTIFVEVTVFGREADYVKDNISTGARIAIEGRVSTRPKTTKSGDTYQEQYIACNRLTNLSVKREA